MKNEHPDCAQCPFKVSERICRTDDGKAPLSCPTKNKASIIDESIKEYEKSDILEFAKQASIQEGEGYGDKELGYEHIKPIKPRILEVVEFSQKMNFKRLGLAFCVGLRKEAGVVGSFFSSKGFEVVSVICKVGRIPKEKLNVRDDQKIAVGRFESICNPVLQAMILNDEKTDFNILLGLCVGHDSLFFKYADAPCTVLAVKDRLLGHNPMAAVYTMDTYYRGLK